jgi:ABC-type polysaccharide/polyol phosphate transport system ATPase subunit
MTDVLRVATRVLWLDGGVLRADGDPQTLVAEYLAEAHHEPRPTSPEG